MDPFLAPARSHFNYEASCSQPRGEAIRAVRMARARDLFDPPIPNL